MPPIPRTQDKKVPAQALEVANDQKQQIEDQRTHLESLKQGGDAIMVDRHKTVPATIPENQKKKDAVPFQSTPLFSKDAEGNPYKDANGSPTKQPVYFDIFRYDAAGQLDLSQYAQPKWFSRTIATTYQLTNEHQVQLDESADVLPRILPGLFPQIAWGVVYEDQAIRTLQNGLTAFIEQRTKRLKQESGLINQTTPLVKEFLEGNAFSTASEAPELVDAKNLLNEAQKYLLADNLGVTAQGGRVIGFADDSGASVTATEYKKDWQACQEKIRNVNISLAWQNGQYTGDKLGVPYTLSLYYDSNMMDSEEGRKLLCDQIDAHVLVANEIFAPTIDPGRYPSFEALSSIVQARLAAEAAAQTRGGDATLQEAAGPLAIIRELSKDLDKKKRIAEKLKTNNEQAKADVAEAAAKLKEAVLPYTSMVLGPDARGSIGRVQSELLVIKSQIAANDPAAARAFFDFKLKYAITQNYEIRHPEQGTPERIAKNYGGEGWIAPASVAGYLAFNLAMDYTGRGTVFVPSKRPVLNVEHGVDALQSKPKMGVGVKVDGMKYAPDEGYARVLWRVSLRSDSACKEYAPSFSQRLIELATQANSVWNSKTGRFEPIDNIVVQPDVKVTDLGNGRREYTIEIRDPYQVKTHAEVDALHKTIRIPDMVGAGSKPLAVYEMTAWLPLASGGGSTRVPPVPSQFRLGIMAGITSVPTYGYTKNIFKGGDDGSKNANAPAEGMFGHRPESAGGYVDLFSSLGYSPLSKYENARRATYWSDRQYNAYRFAGSGELNQPLFSGFGTKTVGESNYLAGFDLATLQKIHDRNKDSIIKNLFTPGLSDQLPQDPVLKDKPYDFLDSIGKIREFSPLSAITTDRQLWKGWLIQIRNLTDPTDAKTIALLDDQIDRASGATISKPANEIFPTTTRGVAAWGVTSDMLARIGESARQHGITAIFSFNPNHRLMVTFCPGLGDKVGLGQSIYNPNFPLTTKLVNSSMLVLNEQFNLYKYEGDRSIFNMDFVAEVGLFWVSNPRNYKYNEEVWAAWGPLSAQRDAPVDKKNAQTINSAAKVLRTKLFAEDSEGREIADLIIRYSDPYNPDADATSATGRCANALRRMSEHISTPPMYTGGGISGSFMETGMYGNGLGTYRSIDKLYLGGANIIPFGNMRTDFKFKEKDTRLLGLFPKGADVDLEITGSMFIPSAPYTAAFQLFNKNRAVNYAIDDMPQITKNWIPPIPFRLVASRTVPFLTSLAGEFGASFSANATAVQLSEAILFARLYSGSVLPGTNTQLTAEAGYAGTGLGALNPTLRAQLQTYTTQLPWLGNNARLGASVDYMFSKMAWGQVSNFGVRLQFTYMLGGPNEVKTPGGETAAYMPNADTRYSPLQWEKFGDPDAAQKKFLEWAKTYNTQNPARPQKPIEQVQVPTPSKNAADTNNTATPSNIAPGTGTVTLPDTETVAPEKVTPAPKKTVTPPVKTEPKKETQMNEVPKKAEVKKTEAPKKEEEGSDEAVPLEPEEKKKTEQKK